jgi:hypothetical protein
MFVLVLYCHLNHQTKQDQAHNPYRRFATVFIKRKNKTSVGLVLLMETRLKNHTIACFIDIPI